MSVSLDPGPSSPQQSVSADAENAPAAPRQDSFAATPAAPWPQLDMKTVEPLFNLAVIVASVAFVVNLLVTIDADVWRGWTWEEVLLRVPGDSWAAYESTLEMEPLMTKVELNTLIYALGDFIAQAVEGGGVSLNFSLTRMARNALIGFCLGFFAHYYYELGEMLLPSENRMLMPLKIGIDQTFYASLWNSLYFAALGLLKGKSPEWIATDVKSKFWPLLKAGWKLWPFAHIITYGVIPVRHRLLWVDSVDLVWCAILASFGAEEAGAAEVAEEAAAEKIVAEEAVVAAEAPLAVEPVLMSSAAALPEITELTPAALITSWASWYLQLSARHVHEDVAEAGSFAPIALSEPPGATTPEPASEAVEDEPATDRTASQPGEGLGLGAALRSGTAAAAATTAAVIQTAAETASSLIPPM